MPLDKLKKQAKNLHRLLPDFVREHKTELQLAHCQELIARINGFPNWHVAVSRVDEPSGNKLSDTAPVRGIDLAGLFVDLVVTVNAGDGVGLEGDDDGHYSPAANQFLTVSTHPSIEKEIDELDEFLDTSGWRDWDSPPVELAQELIQLCEELIRRQPSFLDGYAHLAVALMHMGKHREVLERFLPVYEKVVFKFPDAKKFRGLISYSELENRPFHRLAMNLVVSAYEHGTLKSNAIGAKIARQLYAWWPNDNLGFRFMLTAAEYATSKVDE